MFYDKEVKEEPDRLHRVLRLIYTSKAPTFSKADLERIGVTTGSFDLWDAVFLSNDSKCFFKPFSKEELHKWRIPAHVAGCSDIKKRLDLKEVDPNSSLAQNPSSSEIRQGIRDVLAYLNTHFTFRSNGIVPLCGELGWSVIDPRMIGLQNTHFLFSGHGTQEETHFLSWQVWSMQVWREKNLAGVNFETGPSVRMIISTEAIGPCDRIFLHELGAIAECISFRRRQQTSATYPIVPVLLLSFFGRRNGRIIQACYDMKTGKIELLISPILSFLNKDDTDFDIFLRFMASCPPESCSLDQSLSRMSISSPPTDIEPRSFQGI
ncbi:unnamed protein product [Penicillium olsonii]|nr:unnamed protein product [Penicillium olsonii]